MLMGYDINFTVYSYTLAFDMSANLPMPKKWVIKHCEMKRSELGGSGIRDAKNANQLPE